MAGSWTELEFTGEKAAFQLPEIAFFPELIPSCGVDPLIPGNFLFGGLQGIVGGIVGDIQKEGVFGGSLWTCGNHLINEVDREIRDGISNVEWLAIQSSGNLPFLGTEAERVVSGKEIGGTGEVPPVVLESKLNRVAGEVQRAQRWEPAVLDGPG